MPRSDLDRGLLLLALHRAPGLGCAAREIILDATLDAKALADLRSSDLARLTGRAPRAWEPARLVELAAEDAEALARIGARYVQRRDPRFPALLREIPDPPFGLFIRGGDFPAALPAVAVVGTRTPTGRGLAAARRLARDLAAAGLPVVSGLARGIDGAAHRGALDARRASPAAGPTCAVLPRGIDGVYPLGHRGLAAAILESGGILVSEYPPGTPVASWRFPERNRVLSGLARGCVVVEAPARSGALITADFALEQGRDVLVAAAPLGGPRDAGAEGLAEEGAAAIQDAGELLESWGIAPRAVTSFATVPGGRSGSETEGSRLAAALRAELGSGARRAAFAAAE